MKQRLMTYLIIVVLASGVTLAQQPDANADLRSLVEAERSFARAAGEKGMKDAFIAFADDDGIAFRRVPVNAKEMWRAINPAPAGLLSWRPLYADVSRAGDLGYTTGPYEFREHPDDKNATSRGEYVTIWRRQPDGTWKFALDLGIHHGAPPASAQTAEPQFPPASKTNQESTARNSEKNDASASLLSAENELARAYSKDETSKAFIATAADDVRLYRPDNFPLIGKDAARNFLNAYPETIIWSATKAEAARSGDLGYAYGTYETRAKATDVKPAEQGNYMRVWKRQPGGKWRVVLEITNPVPPLPPSP